MRLSLLDPKALFNLAKRVACASMLFFPAACGTLSIPLPGLVAGEEQSENVVSTHGPDDMIVTGSLSSLQSFQSSDLGVMQNNLNTALSFDNDIAFIAWNNTETGNSGKLTPFLQDIDNATGQTCRPVMVELTGPLQNRLETLTACKNLQEQWVFQS